MGLIRKVKFKWWYCIIFGLAAIIDGLTMVLTLGYFATGFSLKIAFYGASKRIYKQKE